MTHRDTSGIRDASDTAATPYTEPTLIERLRCHGAGSLSDAELLALFMSGACEPELIRRARGVLAGSGGLHRVTGETYRGARSACLTARCRALLDEAMEVARRCTFEGIRESDALSSPEAVRAYLSPPAPRRPRARGVRASLSPTSDFP